MEVAGGHPIRTAVQRVCARRIMRFGLMGSIGIPVNNLALALFEHLVGGAFWLDVLCAFEVSTTVTFVLNQLYTYRDQTPLGGWAWPRRALKAQVSSLSAWLLALLIGVALKYGLQVNDFVAMDVGFVCAFGYNFVVSKRVVFTPVRTER